MFQNRNICLLLLYVLACKAYNIAVSNDANKVITPYPENTSQILTNPIFFGYDFSIKNGTEDNPSVLSVGAPKRNTLNSTLPQSGKPSFNNTGNILNCELSSFAGPGQCQPVNLPPDTVKGNSYGLSLNYFGPPENETLLVCSPNKAEVCHDDRESHTTLPGFCYRTSDGGESWSLNPRTKELNCPSLDRDIIFLIDGSDSVGLPNFNKVKRWIINLSARFGLSNNETRIGVIQYSLFFKSLPIDSPRQRYLKTEIALGEYTNQKDFNNAVTRIRLQGIATDTSAALQKAILDFQSSPRFDDPETEKVLIVLTDGRSTDPENLPQSAEDVRDLGIATFAVGVGREVNADELRTIATGNTNSPERVFFVEDFDALDGITDTLFRQIEEGPLEGSSGSNSSDTNNELTFAESGLSAHSSLNRTVGGMYLGAVGAYDWSGTIVKYDNSQDQTPDIPTLEMVQAVLPNRTMFSYLGYAITSGFYYTTRNEYVAIGAPRNQLYGAVVVYQPTDNIANFTNAHTIYPQTNVSKQLGSYFGGVLLSADINRDNREDLFIAAPLFIGSNFDDGRVFVYTTSAGANNPQRWADPSYKPTILSAGPNDEGGRFGAAMANAGDLNDDNFNDVIIGAPYLDGNRGAVYVFHGSINGIDPEVKQIIKASSLNMNLQYFGLSLEGGQDLDGNEYPDIAVGAPKSDTVIIFRSRPVVQFTTRFAFSETRIPVLECLNVTNRNCINLTACLTTSGKNVEPSIPVNIQITLDTNVPVRENKRIEFQMNGTSSYVFNDSISLLLNTEECKNLKIFVKETINDYTTPMNATFAYSLAPEHTMKVLSSVRDPTIPNVVSANTQFQSDCSGENNECIYDLVVKSNLTLPKTSLTINGINRNEPVLIVSEQAESNPITVSVNLSNSGQDVAFGVRIDIFFNSPLIWQQITKTRSSTGDDRLPCVYDINLDGNDQIYKSKTLEYRLSSGLGNIMEENSWCYFEFNISQSNLRLSGTLEQLNITLKAFTLRSGEGQSDSNPDDNVANNVATIRYRADVTVSSPQVGFLVPFNFTDKNQTIFSVQGIGENTTEISMLYRISGNGYTNIPVSQMKFTFPYTLPSGDIYHILYLFDYTCQTASGIGSCTCDDSVVNEYNLTKIIPSNVTGLSNVTVYANPDQTNESSVYDCSNPENLRMNVCETFSCNITNLGATEALTLRLRFRLWSQSFHLLLNTSNVTIISGFQYNANGSPLLINSQGNNNFFHSSSVNTTARLYTELPSISPRVTPIWIYIVSAIAGLLLLILIIIILWKTGFFKSKYAEKKEALAWTEANGSE